MPLDHYVSQVHLKNFYASALGERMYAIRKTDLKRYTCDAYSQCRIEDGSTNPYLQEPRAIEDFLRTVEPAYNTALEALRHGNPDRDAIHAIAGFAAYVQGCSPGGMRIHARPLQETVKVTAELLDAAGDIPPSPPALGGKSITELLRSKEVVINVDPKYPQSLGIDNILRSTSVWGNSAWDVILNDEPSTPFFTSDYPLAIEPSGRSGIVNRLLPLAPNLAIRIRPNPNKRGRLDLSFQDFRVRRVRAGHQDVRQINQLIVQCAESVVFFCQDLPWISGFVEKHRSFRIEPNVQRVPMGGRQMILSSLAIARIGTP